MDRDQALWDYLEDRDKAAAEQFATGLIGIGALFFAYGEVTDPFVRSVISLVGLGGSVALWLHAYGATRDRNSGLEELKRSKEGRAILRRQFRAASWRDRGKSRYYYVSFTGAANWVLGWVAVAWLLIVVVNDVQVINPLWLSGVLAHWLEHFAPVLLSIAGLGAGLITYAALLWQHHRKGARFRGEWKEWPEPQEVDVADAPSEEGRST